jgi:hypothetical protein
MRGIIPSLLQYALIVWCLVKHRVNFIFTFLQEEYEGMDFYLNNKIFIDFITKNFAEITISHQK